MLILAGVSLNAIIGDNGIITNAQKAKIDSEKADLWERIQEILVEAYTIKFDDITDQVAWISSEFVKKELDATVGVYDYEGRTMLITYGIKAGYRYSAIIGEEMNMVDEIASLVIGEAYVHGDSSNTGVWEIEIISADNLSGQYNGSIGTARIIDYHGTESEIEIPNVINYTVDGVTKGYAVTELGNSVFARYNDEDDVYITSITLNEGLKVIGNGCFKYDNLLECTLTLPNTLKYIGDNAFYKCTNIEGNLNTIVSQGITMGKNVFYGCKKMTGDISLLMPEKVGEDYDQETKDTFAQIDSETGNKIYAIPDGFLSGCSGLTGRLTIPYFIQKIGANAFYNCSGIRYIEYEDNSDLTEIGDSAFYGCSGNCSDIEFPISKFSNVIKIGEFAYASATGGKIDLTNISEIGRNCFSEYAGHSESSNIYTISVDEVTYKKNASTVLAIAASYSNAVDVELGNLITVFPTKAFYNAKLRNVSNSIMRNSTTSVLIENQCFYNSTLCKFELNISNIPSDSSCTIGDQAFTRCSCLSVLTLSFPKVLVGGLSFCDCWRLSSMDFSTTGGVGQSFARCYSLKSFNISNLSSVGFNAFTTCCNLESISYTSGNTVLSTADVIVAIQNTPSIRSIGANAFNQCKLLTGTINGKLKNINNANVTFTDSSFKGTDVTITNDRVFNLSEFSNGIIPQDEFSNVTKFLDPTTGLEIKTLTIGSPITTISARAFQGCTSIETVIIGNNVTSIGEAAFSGCRGLSEVTLPTNNSITEVPNNCFYGCISLTSIQLPTNITTLRDNAFCYDTALATINLENITYIEAAALMDCRITGTGCTFNENLSYIGDSAFRGCFTSADKITLPDGVTAIAKEAFKNCKFSELTWGCSSITRIPELCFSGSSMTKLIITTNTITSIGESAFNNCPSLTGIYKYGNDGTTLETWDGWANLTSIGLSAFKDCSAMNQTIYLNKNCSYDELTTFDNCGLKIK